MSPLINPNTSEALDMSPIKGTRHGKIVSAEPGVSKAGGAKVVVKWEVDVDGQKRPREQHLAISGKGSGGFDNLLRAVGFSELADKYKDPNQPNPPFDTDLLTGLEANLVFAPNLYEGQERDQISTVLPK
jgi:hypothetical protein